MQPECKYDRDCDGVRKKCVEYRCVEVKVKVKVETECKRDSNCDDEKRCVDHKCVTGVVIGQLL